MNHITAQYNKFRADPERMDDAYADWLDQQDDDADTSWEAFQAECQADYERNLDAYLDEDYDWRRAA
jgi:hypothetical protein